MSAIPSLAQQSPAHTWFMQNLTEIQSRSRACLSRVPSRFRDDAMAEVIANVFKASVSAQRRGVLARITPFRCVLYAVKQYHQGRRMAGYTSTDVMSEAAQAKGRCTVVPLSTIVPDENKRPMPLSETLADQRQDNSPPEQVRRNMDYPEILEREQVGYKARRVFAHLTEDRTLGCGMAIARELRVSPGRICQFKQQLAQALARHDYATA